MLTLDRLIRTDGAYLANYRPGYITQWLKNLAEFRFKIVLIARKVRSRYGFRTILIRELSPIHVERHGEKQDAEDDAVE